MTFQIYIGIDYSGAETPKSSLPGLRAYVADCDEPPIEVPPPASPRKYWSRRGLAEWLLERLSDDKRILVGIDHGFSFPKAYFDRYQLTTGWPTFLNDFQRHWPTDDDNTYVSFVLDGIVGNGAARSGSARWRRLTEKRAGAAKSVFHFNVQGQVATSTHAGLPWLRYLLQRVGERVHFWPFDGWELPKDRSVVAEVYPVLWARRYPTEGRTRDQHDAYSVARWLRETDLAGRLTEYTRPNLTSEEQVVATVEGWILGVL